ncbi:MAG TPA: YiiX/YebB-like N1pC/P60 family cysteine hydrolase, partial [Candidatus Bathyarchaeia archaeon]|nr:YiiX/YebB-like N1pC/P60 family cysteine hydrolase [Candidatus Bathyarchaeia archaeon]
IGPVKKTPINEWIARGIRDEFTVVRLREEYQDMIPVMIQAAQAYQGRPYDIQYEWDDQKIYCSELLYKAVRDASGMALAEFERLGDMNWQPHEKIIRELSGGKLPLDRLMITPDAIAFSDKVRTIFSSFPVVSKGSRIYNEKELAGVWEGCYTLVQQRLSLDMEISQNGEIKHGRLQQGLAFDPVMLKQLNPRTGEFFYDVVSENKVKIHIAGRMDHTPGAIYGEWKDSLGFQGTFHVVKK